MTADGTTVPKYVQVEQQILREIREGKYGPGTALPGEVPLARELGVSYLTCRRAVGNLVAQGYLERRGSRGTFVCSRPVAGNVAVLIFNAPSLRTHLSTMELEIIRRRAEAEGRQVRAMLLLPPLPPPDQIVAELRSMQVGAIGLIGFLNSDLPFIQRLAYQMPCVLINKSLQGLTLPCATPDAGTAARLAVDHLHRLGRQRVSFISTSKEHGLYVEMSVALEHELHRRGMPVDRSLWYERSEYGSDMREVDEWYETIRRRGVRPDAMVTSWVFCPTALKSASLEPAPREVEVVALSSTDDPRITCPTIVWNYEDAARHAADMLMQCVTPGERLVGAPVMRSEPFIIYPEGARPS